MPLEKIEKRVIKIFKEDEITIKQSPDKKESGSYGEIVFGIINDTGVSIALKRFKEDYSNHILDKDVIKEIIMLQLFNQFPETNTVQFYGIYFSDDRKNLYLVLEILETTLHNISIRIQNDDTKNKGILNADQYKIIFYKLLKSINAIHSLGFLHNDIKLANIMLNNTDIKLIDFGLSKFIGLSPIANQVRDSESTNVIKAPDKRISFSSDIFSLASSMVHLCIRDYRSLYVSNDKIYDKYDMLSDYLSAVNKFGVHGHNLLIKLLDNNVERRWCANKALQHPYFDSLRSIENIAIDRTLVGMQGGINGVKHHMEYIDRNFAEKNLELCYFEEMYYNYKDMICPSTQITTNINQYHTLMNWILEKCNDGLAFQKNGIFYGIDTIINGIIMTKKDISSYRPPVKPTKLPIIHHNFIYTTFNMILYQDITVNKRPNFEYILDRKIDDKEISEFFYQYLNDINIDFYPISIHISYIYLQLAHELKTIRYDSKKTFQFYKNFFVDLCVQIIIWFIQPIPFEKDISISDVVVFSAIKLLSNILITSHITLIENPIIPVLTMDLEKYEEMLIYYKVQYTSMEFDKYEQYAIYFNKPIFT
jgi:serine/threonine protein kinase